MSTPRKHHYVPIFYLNQWKTSDNQICEYKRICNRIATDRKSPRGTGYEVDLYKVDGLPAEQSQVFESSFLSAVDSQANLALQRIISGDRATLDTKLRSSWTRFVWSLHFRNPEMVRRIKAHLIDAWRTGIQELEATYDQKRQLTDPKTFTEFLAQTDPAGPHKATALLLQEFIDNPKFGQTLFEMNWHRVSLAASNISLLTSDRPIDRPLGLNNANAYIALPMGPKTLFVAERGYRVAKHLDSENPTKVAKAMNLLTVRQARTFVWGCNDSHLKFVEKHIGTAPDPSMSFEIPL